MLKLLVAIAFFVSYNSQAEICREWAPPVKIGSLETSVINEASGLAFSKQFPNRAYHINDSGDGPNFYITDSIGSNTKKVSIDSMIASDVEDIAVGPCPSGQCVFIADIGDNLRARNEIEIWMVPEIQIYSDTVSNARKIVLQYPDHSHDAEAIAVDPASGDILLLTKEADYKIDRRALAAKLFKISQASLAFDKANKLQFVGEVDVPWMNYDFGLFGQIVTGMDISSNGENLILLTYENAIEINMQKLMAPINTRSWIEDTDYKVIRWPNLVSQQEAIAYSNDGKSFYFDTEFNPSAGDKEAPIYEVKCLK